MAANLNISIRPFEMYLMTAPAPQMLLPSPEMVKESRCQVCDGGSCSDSGTSPGPEDERSLKLLMCGPTVALQ